MRRFCTHIDRLTVCERWNQHLFVMSIFVAAFPDQCIIPRVCCVVSNFGCYISLYACAIFHLHTFIYSSVHTTHQNIYMSSLLLNRSCLHVLSLLLDLAYFPSFLCSGGCRDIPPVPLGDILIHIQMLKAYPCLLLPSRAPFITLML